MNIGLRWLAWMAATAAGLVLLAQPVGTGGQLAMSLAAMAAMVGLWLAFDGPRSRFVFLAMGSLVVLRYVLWRVTSTLPPPGDPLNFGFGLILLGAELYCVFILFVSLIVNADPLDRPAPPRGRPEDQPAVDIFVPSYNEDAAILAVTLAAARRIDYPAGRLTVWLLDDGGTDQKCADADPGKAAAARGRRATLQALCADLGCRYLTRERNLHAKAGNLNNGLAAAAGEIVVVFDADHVPFRSFLTETVGHFAQDPRLFLVQTPHAFLNPDPVERNLRTFERMPSENEMFYSVTQRGLDKWNGSFFCGSAALLRRAALDEAGGFSGITITEDCETAFELHARGWTSVYVDTPLIAGLQPDTLTDFVGQRSRWCQGMFQILLLKNPALKRGLKPIQRLAYLSSMTFWFFPVPRLIFMLAPLLHIFFDLKIFVASVDESIAYTATYVVTNLMLQNYVYGRFRWPFVSELYEYVQGVFLSKAIVSVMWSPRKPTFNVTNKGASLDHDHLSALAWPFFAIWGLLLVGGATALWRYLFEPGVTNLMLVVGLWTLFNLLTAGAALGVCAERRQTERTPSLRVERRATLTMGERSADVQVERVSAESCTLRLGAGFASSGGQLKSRSGSLAVVPVPGAAAAAPLPVTLGDAVREGDTFVCRFGFGRLTPATYPALAELMYGDAGAMRRFQSRRRRHKDLFTGTLQFVWWGLVEPVRAIRYAILAPKEVAQAPRADAQAARDAEAAQEAETAQEAKAVQEAEAAHDSESAGDIAVAPASSPPEASSAAAPSRAPASRDAVRHAVPAPSGHGRWRPKAAAHVASPPAGDAEIDDWVRRLRELEDALLPRGGRADHRRADHRQVGQADRHADSRETV